MSHRVALVVSDGKYTETAGEEAVVDVKYMVINGRYVIVSVVGEIGPLCVLFSSLRHN